MGSAQDTEQRRSAGADSGRGATAGCQIWGVLNVTPDSFSDGGLYQGVEDACEQARRMWDEGAAVIDVGGESTRPRGKTYGAGATPVSAEEELSRVLPVVERLVAEGMRVSVDTTKPDVAAPALAAGAAILNDVSMGRDRRLLEVVAEAGADLVLMHNRGRGERDGTHAHYEDVSREALSEVRGAMGRALEVGVFRERLWLDPGLGFAKSHEASRSLLSELGVWVQTEQPILVGASRKSFLAFLGGTPGAPAGARLGASLVAALAAQRAGCAAVRVHDVSETYQALRAARELWGDGLR